MNVYFSTEPFVKLQNVILNIRSFYVFDVQEFISGLDIDPAKPANVFYINSEIIANISAAARLKKYQGIIYINRNLTPKLYESMRLKIGSSEFIDKFVLLDNGNVHKLKKIYNLFDEVIFYDRFRKIRIVECNPNISGSLLEFRTRDLERFPKID